MKATDGKIDRVYAYLGEKGENLELTGVPTPIEKNYKLINTFSEESKQPDYWEKDELVFPDEELVMKIAENWSVNPIELDGRSDIKGVGLVAEF